MKTYLLTFILFISGLNIINGQSKTMYYDYTSKADSLFQINEYKESSLNYAKAFEQMNWKARSLDRYNAARAYALSNVSDSAFLHLNKLANSGKFRFKEYDKTINDESFEILKVDNRWMMLLDNIKSNKEAYDKNINLELVAHLDSIRNDDQKLRHEVSKIDETFGWESNEMKKLWRKINLNDSINKLKIANLLNEKGWPSPSVMGDNGSMTIFLVIQHADLDYQKNYLPIVRSAVQNKYLRASSLAMLEDRMALREGDKQIYGTQIYTHPKTGEDYLAPMIDPENVDKRRAEVGLGSLQDYISKWGMTWDYKEYLEKLPEYEELTNQE